MKKPLRFVIRVFAFLIFPTLLLAQSGKIAGRVTDKTTGEGLPFVNVVIVGSTQGAASDADGYYSILNVRPGTYIVKASAIGYNSSTTSNVRVSIDLTTKVDVTLSETSVTTQEVVVVAEKPLVTKDLTSSTSIVGADEIAALPVTEFSQVLNLKAGMVGGHVRGGRSGEVVYAIDGVPVTDVYDGSTVVEVNANSIQELQFVSGAFNAEYGKALSGYVNIATKDGDNKFNGTATSYIGSYYSTHTDIFRELNKVRPFSTRNFEGSLSGPIIPNEIFFYTNIRYIYFGGWEYGIRKFNPWDITINNGGSDPLKQYTIQETGDGKVVPMNWNEKLSGQGKISYRIVPELKLSYNYLYERKNYREYNYYYSYNPDGLPYTHKWANTNILGLTHTIGANTYQTLNISYFFNEYRTYAYEDPHDPRYTADQLLSLAPANGFSFLTGGTSSDLFKRTTASLGIKYDITSQVNKINQVKAGFEFDRHFLTYDRMHLADPTGLEDVQISKNPYSTKVIPDINNPDDYRNIDMVKRIPTEMSGYIQDKMELNELIINFGVRFDYFDPNGQVLTDLNDPDVYNPMEAAHQEYVDSLGVHHNTLAQRKAYWYKSTTKKFQISPRLGVAFPITDRGVIHFSYGHFFQTPNFEYLYFTQPDYKLGAGTGNLGLVGNPDLKPQQTISGEVGVQQALTDDITFDLTGYFRDISNLAGSGAREIPISNVGTTYSMLTNSDFGFVKGVIFTLTKRLSNNWTATIDYTLQLAQGNASDPTTTFNQIVNKQQPAVQLIRLDQDQTHTLNVTFSYASPDLWGFSLIGSYGSGFPYTPSQSTMSIAGLLTNTETKPTYFNVDLRAYKDFQFGLYKLSLFLRVNNLFDIKNQVNVYSDSGTADFTESEYLAKQDPTGRPALVNSVDEYYSNPTMYSEPRRIEFGATLFF
jgi:outer membrane receptor protein involved in Fe transport